MKKKAKKAIGKATRASVRKEMAKPRMSKSAREGVFHLAAVQTMELRFAREPSKK